MFHTIHKEEDDLVRIAETPDEIFERTRAREIQLCRLLVFYISGGLLFMLLPGTFLGGWNLVSISGRRASESISPAWIQARTDMHRCWAGSGRSFLVSGTIPFPNCRAE